MDLDFLEDLASSDPTPGGGGASAYVAAVASALASMVGNLTVGKAAYAEHEADILGALGRLSVLRSRLIALVEEDEIAFGPLSIAYKMPKATEEEATLRSQAIQDSLFQATEVPLKIMRACLDVLYECEIVDEFGSRMARSDVGAAATIAFASIVSASLNVYANANLMDDKACASDCIHEAESLIREGREHSLHVLGNVAQFLGADELEDLCSCEGDDGSGSRER